MLDMKLFLIIWLNFVFSYQKIIKWNPEIPPIPKYSYNINNNQLNIENFFESWTPDSNTNLWEYSGLYEGDIMLYHERNGIINQTLHWINATVPFYIDSNDFNQTQITIILKSFHEFHEKSCIRFRPYINTDQYWILIKGNHSGCWSSVGMHNSGQIMNIQSPNCVRHGIIIHELLHVLGFYHQQSSTDRDNYIKINWENILNGREHNFQKYHNNYISNYNISYDYNSIMHYSNKAFTKNGLPTIESLKENAMLGQRKQMTTKDVLKLNRMYKCNNNATYLNEKFMIDLIRYFNNDEK